jgi:hypothetical protein
VELELELELEQEQEQELKREWAALAKHDLRVVVGESTTRPREVEEAPTVRRRSCAPHCRPLDLRNISRRSPSLAKSRQISPNLGKSPEGRPTQSAGVTTLGGSHRELGSWRAGELESGRSGERGRGRGERGRGRGRRVGRPQCGESACLEPVRLPAAWPPRPARLAKTGGCGGRRGHRGGSRAGWRASRSRRAKAAWMAGVMAAGTAGSNRCNI